MGGCSIDLEGGEYRISKPLVLVRTPASAPLYRSGPRF